MDASDPNYSKQQMIKSSACSNNSENSKGSGLSLSRSIARVNNRETKYIRAERDIERDRAR